MTYVIIFFRTWRIRIISISNELDNIQWHEQKLIAFIITNWIVSRLFEIDRILFRTWNINH